MGHFVANRLAKQGIPALVVPLFACTAPELELGYKASDLPQGRAYKDAITASQILSNFSAAMAWLQQLCPRVASIWPGSASGGGRAALLASTLPQMRCVTVLISTVLASAECVLVVVPLPWSSCRRCPVSSPVCAAVPILGSLGRTAMRSALAAADPSGERLRYVGINGVNHGFMCEMCEARASFNQDASALDGI